MVWPRGLCIYYIIVLCMLGKFSQSNNKIVNITIESDSYVKFGTGRQLHHNYILYLSCSLTACIIYKQLDCRTNNSRKVYINWLVIDLRLATRGKHLLAMYTGCGAFCSKLFCCLHTLICMSSVLQIGYSTQSDNSHAGTILTYTGNEDCTCIHTGVI